MNYDCSAIETTVSATVVVSVFVIWILYYAVWWTLLSLLLKILKFLEYKTPKLEWLQAQIQSCKVSGSISTVEYQTTILILQFYSLKWFQNVNCQSFSWNYFFATKQKQTNVCNASIVCSLANLLKACKYISSNEKQIEWEIEKNEKITNAWNGNNYYLFGSKSQRQNYFLIFKFPHLL